MQLQSENEEKESLSNSQNNHKNGIERASNMNESPIYLDNINKDRKMLSSTQMT